MLIDPSWRILIAEDNLFNQIVVEAMLNHMGLTADVAQNGREVIQMLEEKDYDLVLMDIQMPEMDGVEATKIIRRSDRHFKTIPIVALTADAFAESRDLFLKAGLNGYLIKPIMEEDLKSAICEQLCKV